MAAPFVQLLEYTTEHADEVARLVTQWLDATEGRRRVQRASICRDARNPHRYIHVVEFTSRDDAVANGALVETEQFAHRLAELCTGIVRYTDLDVLDQHERVDTTTS
jgi:hypothetical protein